MTIDATVKTIIIAALLAISIPLMFLYWKAPKPTLSASEKELITFTNTPVEMTPPKSQIIYTSLENPVRVTVKEQAPFGGSSGSGGKNVTPSGRIPVGGTTPSASRPILRNTFGSHPVVSMIYTEGSEKIAIIDGQVLHEGSVFGGNRIVTIEKSRVRMKSAGRDIWLSID